MERMCKRGVALQWKVLSPEACLAQTAALEHVTATLAELVLTDEVYRKSWGAAEDLFVWHALEEAEHKAVAFDVYRAVGGSERLRARTMMLTRWMVVLGLPVQVLVSLALDRATYRRGNLRRSFRRLRSSALMRKSTWDRLQDYERPDFHPNDWDNTELVDEWRSRLFGAEGDLNRWLIGSVA
jgi:predicted metal-dependent hydrolase